METSHSSESDRVVFLGSASGQTKLLEPVSFLIVSSSTVLVEAGPSVIRQLEAAGYRPKDLAAVFITHSHADHCLGFPYLAFNKHIDRLQNNDEVRSLSVVCRSDLWSGLFASTAFHYPPGSFPTFEYDVHQVTTPHRGSVAGFSYEAIDVRHTVPTLALRLTTPRGKTVVYSSDTIYDPAVVSLAQGSDLLIHEAMFPSTATEASRRLLHATIADAARAAREAQPRALAVCHMIPPLYAEQAAVTAEIAAAYGGSTFFPREGTVIELP